MNSVEGNNLWASVLPWVLLWLEGFPLWLLWAMGWASWQKPELPHLPGTGTAEQVSLPALHVGRIPEAHLASFCTPELSFPIASLPSPIIWSDKTYQGIALSCGSIQWLVSWDSDACRCMKLGNHLSCDWGTGNFPAQAGVGKLLCPRVPECTTLPAFRLFHMDWLVSSEALAKGSLHIINWQWWALFLQLAQTCWVLLLRSFPGKISSCSTCPRMCCISKLPLFGAFLRPPIFSHHL